MMFVGGYPDNNLFDEYYMCGSPDNKKKKKMTTAVTGAKKNE